MIVTLEEAREYLRIDEDDTSNDDVIQSSLETAQALCLDISRCRRESRGFSRSDSLRCGFFI